ncbi:MAG TPA: GNAT family N-acetyltransferase [Candidatus Lustribacter sp.]
MDDTLRIREMEPGDLDPMLLLFDAVAQERLWIGTEPGFDRQRYRDTFGMALGHGNGMFVALWGERLVGIATEHQHEPYGHMLGMLVDEAYRGRGVGRALIERITAWARDQGFAHLNLSVFPHNERAVALYRSCGFMDLEPLPGGVRRANGEVWDAIVMRKTLR